MPVSAVLVDAGDPQPVQVVLTGIPAGQAFELRGTAAGKSWPVPGGVGVSTGEQIVRIDNRAALNAPVVYEAVWGNVVHRSEQPVVVASDADVLVQTLDGKQAAAVELASLPAREGRMRGVLVDVAGRADPAARWDTSGTPTRPYLLEVDGPDNDLLDAILSRGAPVVIRANPALRGMPPSQIAMVTGWSDTYLSELSDLRQWTVTTHQIGDPEPSRLLVAWSWDDVDEALAGMTWDQVDALFAGSTWDQMDTYDWGQLL